MNDENFEKPSGWRVSLSIGMGIGWLIFLIVWLAFFAGDYTVYRNIAIIIISILVVFIVLGGSWASWGLKNMPKEGKVMMKTSGFKSRIVVSIIIPFLLIIFLIYWFFFPAEDFDVYQNIAVFLVSILVVGGLLGGIWAPWGMKHSKEFEKYGEKKNKD
jgi:hypothetical protein